MTSLISYKKYLLGSRMLTHVIFWIGYYILFSLIWAKHGQYYQSFGLELVLMPLRIGASYLVLYWLIPRFVLENRLVQFGVIYASIIIVAGLVQRILTFYFHEVLFTQDELMLWSIGGIIRSAMLVNSTVLFLSSLKMYDYWREERSLRMKDDEEVLEIRSEKRNFRVSPSEILYIEGLGNYVTFYIQDKKPIISYQKLKDLERLLPSQFYRIHKSFIINEDKVNSYSSENIEIQNRMIPVGKNIKWPR